MDFKVFFKNSFIFIFLIFSFYSSFSASEYFGSFNFFLDREGNLKVTGNSNINDSYFGVFSGYTLKNGDLWTLNYSLPHVFNTFYFELELPENSVLRYVKTTPDVRIEQRDEKLYIIGSGENRKLSLVVNYQLKSSPSSFLENNLILFLSLLILFLFISSYFFFRYVFKNSSNLPNEENNSKNLEEEGFSGSGKNLNPVLEYSNFLKKNYNNLPQRQKDIISILMKSDCLTQKKLEELMKIPKSSLSRNLKTLSVKGVVKIERISNTNYISLVKDDS